MLKNVDESCETLEATKVGLEKETLIVSMETKVSMAFTKIGTKIDIAKHEFKREESLDPERRI